MLSSFEKGIITLLNNALKGEGNQLPEDFDYSNVYEFGVKHQILPMLFYGGATDPKFLAGENGSKMMISSMQLTAISENQLSEIDRVCKEFDKNGVDYLKLKGSIIKRLYPQHEMRVMSDSDILIRENQMDKIEKILINLGYKFYCSSDHEWIWQGDVITFEFHLRVVASYQKDFYAFFGDGWKLSKRKNEETSEYVMSLEDEFLYLFTHLAKHYRDAGIGIKHLTDIYLFLKHYTDLDMDYIYTSLDKMHLLEFYKNIQKTLEVWFEGKECDEVSKFITAKIFDDGVYGTLVNSLKADALKFSKGTDEKGAKRKKKIYMIFLPYNRMCAVFPILRKVPILLPFLWIYRLIRVVLFRKDNIKKLNEEVENYSQGEIDEYKVELNYVGLDYNFEV